MNIHFYVYFDIARDVVTVLLMFVDIYHFNHTLLHTNIQTRPHKHTSMVSTQEELRESGTGTWLEGAEVGLVREEGIAHTHTHTSSKKMKMTAHQDLESNNIRTNRASSKATRQFVMS